jgi:hypothetical protein
MKGLFYDGHEFLNQRIIAELMPGGSCIIVLNHGLMGFHGFFIRRAVIKYNARKSQP